MWKKYLPLVALAVGLGLIIYYTVEFSNIQPEAQQPSSLEEANQNAVLPSPAEPVPAPGAAEPVPPIVSGETDVAVPPLPNAEVETKVVPPPVLPAPAEPISSVTVTYDGKTYSPSSAEIKKGQSVIYVNKSSTNMWPASAMHPTHAAYPTTGGCIGSTFDACDGIAPGGSWSFVFDTVGRWGYHDHLNPSARGTVVVK